MVCKSRSLKEWKKNGFLLTPGGINTRDQKVRYKRFKRKSLWSTGVSTLQELTSLTSWLFTNFRTQFPQEKFLSYGRIFTLHYYFLLMCILFSSFRNCLCQISTLFFFLFLYWIGLLQPIIFDEILFYRLLLILIFYFFSFLSIS